MVAFGGLIMTSDHGTAMAAKEEQPPLARSLGGAGGVTDPAWGRLTLPQWHRQVAVHQEH